MSLIIGFHCLFISVWLMGIASDAEHARRRLWIILMAASAACVPVRQYANLLMLGDGTRFSNVHRPSSNALHSICLHRIFLIEQVK